MEYIMTYMMNKYQNIIFLCLLSSFFHTRTMEHVPKEVAWAWVNMWYKDRSPEADKACAEVYEMVKEIPNIIGNHEVLELKYALMQKLKKTAEYCTTKTDLKKLPSDPVIEKYRRKSDKMLIETIIIEKKEFELLKK